MTSNWLKGHKPLIVFALTLLLFLGIGSMTYSLFGHQLVKAMYEGRSIEILNRVIENQKVYPLEYYYTIADRLFIGYSILFTLIFSITFALSSTLNLLDLFVTASTLMAVLFSSGIILKKILLAPFGEWSGARLAWTFSLIRGYKLYYPPDSGPLFSTLSGPLRAIMYLPATLANTPTPALIFASLISACFYFLPILWLHIRKSLLEPRKLLLALYAFACFCLFTFSSPALTYSAFAVYADAPALGFSTVACAILYYRKRNDNILLLLLAALFSVFAVWTKQTLVPLLFALPSYILVTDGYKCFKRYILCLSVCGVVVSALFLWIFNAQNLLFYMLTIPSHCPWQFSANRIIALLTATYQLIRESFLPLTILIFCSAYQLSLSSNAPNKLKVWLSSNQWTMLAIVSLFMVPTSVLGRVKAGGDVNTLSPALYFLVAAVTLALTRFSSDSLSSSARPRGSSVKVLLILLITGLTYANMVKFTGIGPILYGLSSNEQKVAYEYAKTHPGEAYFPTHPLSSLLAEGKLYHHAYGLFDRELSGFQVTSERFRAHVPAEIRLVAFLPAKGSVGAYVLKYLPEFSKQVTIDELPGWIVYMRE